MEQITLAEYKKIHKDYRGVWTTERTDWPNWEEEKSQYLGKRTMLGTADNGASQLLIEGIDFEIIEEE